MTAAIHMLAMRGRYTSTMILRRVSPLVRLCSIGLALMPLAALAQDVAPEVVLQAENVRFEYAQVLAVDPVYQVLRTTRAERVCAETPRASKYGLARVVGAVKDSLALKPDQASPLNPDCQMVPVTRDFRRPIAYDVDYVYKGSKFRTRMARDPGNRLRVRVSITPQPVASP